jgi:hypothetical protein
MVCLSMWNYFFKKHLVDITVARSIQVCTNLNPGYGLLIFFHHFLKDYPRNMSDWL